VKKFGAVALAALLVMAGVLALWWRGRTQLAAAAAELAARKKASAGHVATPPPRAVPSLRARTPEPLPARALSPNEKSARIDKIKRDYDEIRAKASADYTAAGAGFPGGLNAFLRQLALLEREMRADFAAVLSPAELEDLEYRETAAGQLVQRLLGNTAAVDAQRRAVFRAQLEFDDRFALTFDTSPPALLERERARQTLQGAIAGLLGSDELFAAWDADFARCRDFVSQQGLVGRVAWELWTAKNDFTLQRLALASQRGLPPEQLRIEQGNLTRQTETRVLGILGASAMDAARNDLLGWLPHG
jgi:hypothetical protein